MASTSNTRETGTSSAAATSAAASATAHTHHAITATAGTAAGWQDETGQSQKKKRTFGWNEMCHHFKP